MRRAVVPTPSRTRWPAVRGGHPGRRLHDRRQAGRHRATTLGAPYLQLLKALNAQKVAISLDPATLDPSKKKASAPFHTTVTPAGYAPWSWDGTLPLVRSGKTWQVQWTPQLVHPLLTAGETFAMVTTFGTRLRAPILGAGKATLVGSGTVYYVSIVPGRMTDPTAEIAKLAQVLKPENITEADVQAAYDTGSKHPDQKYPLITLRESDFDKIQPTLYALAGCPTPRPPPRWRRRRPLPTPCWGG